MHAYSVLIWFVEYCFPPALDLAYLTEHLYLLCVNKIFWRRLCCRTGATERRRYPFGNVYLCKFKCGINLCILRVDGNRPTLRHFHRWAKMTTPALPPHPVLFKSCRNSRWTALLLTNDMVVVSNAGAWLWQRGAAGHASALQQHLFPLLQLGTDREGAGGWLARLMRRGCLDVVCYYFLNMPLDS